MDEDTDWHRSCQVACGEPHSRILGRALEGGWFDQDEAARANGSTKQSVSAPLKDLESNDLLRV